MKVAVMQPYFLPYIGYFQLIAAVDQFIVYDNIKYTKKGWINRNRMLLNGTDVMFSLPLKKGADSLDVVEREIAINFDQTSFLNKFKGAYRNAPQFEPTFSLLELIVRCEEENLFRFIHYSIMRMCEHLGIKTEIKISSDVSIDHSLKGQDKVLALCKTAGADTYVNTIGGVELYSKNYFHIHGLTLKFIKSRPFEYAQFGKPFVSWLSIVDILMFNPLEHVRECLKTGYELI